MDRVAHGTSLDQRSKLVHRDPYQDGLDRSMGTARITRFERTRSWPSTRGRSRLGSAGRQSQWQSLVGCEDDGCLALGLEAGGKE